MGIGKDEDPVVDDSDACSGGEDTVVSGKSFDSVSCSICLEVVADNGDRSWAKLQCGHQFHLDCIGSAFNIKGVMQCPNCRKIEKGQWLYANGCCSYPEYGVDEWPHDEDLHDLSYSEMSFGVQWCPFGSLARLPSSFEEGEFSSTPYHDLMGQHAMFAEQSVSSAASHPCPYVAYFGPVHPLSSNSNASVSEALNFNHWNGPSIPSEMPTSYAFNAVDLHYNSWEHHVSPFSTNSSRLGGTDNSLGSERPARASSDLPRSGSFIHPFLDGHRSAARGGSSIASSMIPPYPGSNARAHNRVQALQAYYQQQPINSSIMRAPTTPSTRRSTSHRGSAQAAQLASSSEPSGGFLFIPSSSPGRNFQEQESPLPTRFYSWERDHLPSSMLNQVDRDSGLGPYHRAAAMSDPVNQSSSFRLRHGSEQTSSQNRS